MSSLAKLTNKYIRDKSALSVIAVIIAVFMLIFFLGGILFLFSRTLVSPWPVAAIGAAVGFPVSFIALHARGNLGDNILGTTHGIVAVILYGLGITVFIVFAALLLNYCVPVGRPHHENAVVERIVSRKKYSQKRVGRRYVAQGPPYKEYYMEVCIRMGTDRDSVLKEISLGKLPLGAPARRRNPHKGDTLDLVLQKGLLGMPVIVSDLYEFRAR